MANDDMELVRKFVTSQSESAFAALVSRYTNLIYSAAFRRVGNSQLAEEITQAVFIILAQKAGTLKEKTVLPGWLYRAACYVSGHAIKQELRRQRRELEAYMQSLSNQTGPEVWPQITPLLEDAMMRLGQAERDALVLRFFEGQSFKEVSTALGTSEAATKMRVGRALEKLRVYFSRQGVNSTAETIAGAMSANSIVVAPAALAKTTTAVALAKGATASASTLTLIKGALKVMAWTKAKTAVTATVATVITAGIIAGFSLHFFHQPQPSPVSAAPTLPIKFANAKFTAIPANGTNKFICDIDPATRRTTDSAAAFHIKCLVPPTSPGSADYLKSQTSVVGRGFAGADVLGCQVGTNSWLLGKRVRITGWIKASDVRNWAGVTLWVGGHDGYIFALDRMYDRPIHGTTDWQPVEFVTDIPQQPCTIVLEPTLYGTGEIWGDDFQMDVAPAATPTLGIFAWGVWCQEPLDYTETPDYGVTRNGHPTLRLEYVSPEAPQRFSGVWWGRNDLRIQDFREYLGHEVRMSIWVKTENLSSHASLDLEPWSGSGAVLAKQMSRSRIGRGTTDWAEYYITCVIPGKTEDLQTGFGMSGSGKVWLDTNSLKIEIVR